MQSHVHKRECFNIYKLQNGRIGDYPGWGYPMVDYLMALHLYNVIAAKQLKELVSFNLSAAVPAVCRWSALWTSVECSSFVSPVLHYRLLLLCPVTRGLTPTRSDESDCLNLIRIPTICPPPGSPLGPGGPCGPVTPPESPYRERDRQYSEFLHRENVTVALSSQQCKGCTVLHTGRWTRKSLEVKAGADIIYQDRFVHQWI